MATEKVGAYCADRHQDDQFEIGANLQTGGADPDADGRSFSLSDHPLADMSGLEAKNPGKIAPALLNTADNTDDKIQKTSFRKISKKSKKGFYGKKRVFTKKQSDDSGDEELEVDPAMKQVFSPEEHRLAAPGGEFLYKPFCLLPNLAEFLNQVIEVRVDSAYLVSSNQAFRAREIYGTDFYTSHSDIACIAQHTGQFRISDLEPHGFKALQIFFRVSKSKNAYTQSNRNGVKSRKHGPWEGFSIKIEKCYRVN